MRVTFMSATIATLLAGTALMAEWSEPTTIDTDVQEGAALPGGDKAGGESGRSWSYDEPESTNDGGFDDSVVGTEGATQTQETTTTEKALNPGGDTLETDRFDNTTTVTETRTWNEPEEEDGGGPPDDVCTGRDCRR